MSAIILWKSLIFHLRNLCFLNCQRKTTKKSSIEIAQSCRGQIIRSVLGQWIAGFVLEMNSIKSSRFPTFPHKAYQENTSAAINRPLGWNLAVPTTFPFLIQRLDLCGCMEIKNAACQLDRSVFDSICDCAMTVSGAILLTDKYFESLKSPVKNRWKSNGFQFPLQQKYTNIVR